MLTFIRLIATALLIFTFSASALAKSVYIKDELYVPLRSGPSSQHRILHKGLKTSTTLERLGSSNDGAWINVKTPNGLVGWVPAQYVLNEPTAAIRLETTSRRLETITKEHSASSEQLKSLKSELEKTKKKLTKTENAQQKSMLELHRIRSISSGAIELDMKYQKLLEEHELLQTANDTLNAENESLKTDKRFSYMFYGAMLVILGMIMAVIIPRVRVKKRHSEWAN